VARRGWGGAGWGGSKNSKPIPASPCSAGQKSRPIPALLPLQGGENQRGAKRGRVKWGGAKFSSLILPTKITNKMRG